MPIHWGTFNLALHPWYEPIKRILALAERKAHSIVCPSQEPTEVTGAAYNSHWWEVT